MSDRGERTGYYDHHALVRLDRPLALTGFVEEETRLVGHRLAALTGLPFADLDRRIEHRLGMSVRELIVTSSPSMYRQQESAELATLLRDQPAGVVVLGDGVLIDADNRLRLAEQTTLVVLDRDLAGCYWRLRSCREANGGDRWHPFLPSPVVTIDDVRPFYQERRPGFDTVSRRVSVEGRSPARLTTVILDSFPELREDSARPS